MISQSEAVKLMEKLQRLADKRMRIEGKAAKIIEQLSEVAQAGGHEVQEYIKKTGFKKIPMEGANEHENKQDDIIPPEFDGDIR